MTDNEIIKALERMSAEDANGFSSDILGLIKRQQAEIKRLWEDCDYFEDKVKTIKSEAITEFAERLKTKMLDWCFDFEYYSEQQLAEEQVDNLVREMTEGTTQ